MSDEEMSCTFDPEVQGLYVQLQQNIEGRIAKTIPLDNPHVMVNVDVDAEGVPLGVEVLGPSWSGNSP